MAEDFDSPEWRAFGAELNRKRAQEVRNTPASSTFVDKMTSSAADPRAADRPAGEQAAADRDAAPDEPSSPAAGGR